MAGIGPVTIRLASDASKPRPPCRTPEFSYIAALAELSRQEEKGVKFLFFERSSGMAAWPAVRVA